MQAHLRSRVLCGARLCGIIVGTVSIEKMQDDKWDPTPLSHAIKASGLSQNELALLAGLSACSISNYLNSRRVPSRDSLIKIKNGLGAAGVQISLDELCSTN